MTTILTLDAWMRTNGEIYTTLDAIRGVAYDSRIAPGQL